MRKPYHEKTMLFALITGFLLSACGLQQERNDLSDLPILVQSLPVSTAKIPADGALPWCGDGTAEGFCLWAAETAPDALAGIARIGESWDYTGGLPFWENVDSSGYLPFLAAHTPYGSGADCWVDLDEPDHSHEGTIWCILPLEPDLTVTFHRYSWEGQEGRQPIGELTLRPEGKPILFFWNGVCWPKPTLSVTLQGTGQRVTFDLETNSGVPPCTEVPVGTLLLPRNDSVLDFTVYPDSPVAPWRLFGRWQGWEFDEKNGDCHHELLLHPDGRMTWLVRERNHAPAFVSTGIWSMDGEEELILSYRAFPDSGGTGTSLVLRPCLDEHGALTLLDEDRQSDFGYGQLPVFPKHDYFLSEGTHGVDGAEQSALDFYEQLNGSRPAHGEILCFTEEGLLVCLWDDGYRDIIPRGWYVVESEQNTVRDYLTDRTLNLS